MNKFVFLIEPTFDYCFDPFFHSKYYLFIYPQYILYNIRHIIDICRKQFKSESFFHSWFVSHYYSFTFCERKVHFTIGFTSWLGAYILQWHPQWSHNLVVFAIGLSQSVVFFSGRCFVVELWFMFYCDLNKTSHSFFGRHHHHHHHHHHH